MSEPLPIKAIFFDNDGLLVNTEPLMMRATQEILRSIGIEMTSEWYQRENLGKGRSSFSLAAEAGVSEGELDKLRVIRRKRYREILEEGVEPMEGVREFLEWAKGKFLMGIVTGSHRSDLDIVFKETGFGKYFSFSVTGDTVKHGKPDPEGYVKALALSGVAKEECLVLEDSYRGVEAAKAAGLTCFAIPDALTREQNFSIADKVLTSIREVPSLITPV